MGASSPPEQEKQKKMEVMDATLNGFLGRFALNEQNKRSVSVFKAAAERSYAACNTASKPPSLASIEEQCNHDFHASVIEKELNRIAPSVFSEEYKEEN